MREMSEDMRNLLKSKKMIGENRPTHRVILGSGNREPINPLINTGTFVKKILGYDGFTINTISNPVPTKDGRYAFAYANYNDGKVYIAYSNDENFFYDNYTFDSVIETNISMVYTGDISTVYGTNSISLFRRDDGKILLFVNDRGSFEYLVDRIMTISVRVYISNSGNCDDFIYLTSIIDDTKYAKYNSSKSIMNLPIQIKNGNGKRLIVSFVSGTFQDGNTFWRNGYIFYSDDNGLTWNLSSTLSGVFRDIITIGQIAQIIDGSLYCEITDGSSTVCIFKSTDNGTTFSKLAEYYGGIPAIWEGKTGWTASMYYDERIDILYRITVGSGDGSYIWQMKNPTQEKLRYWENWEMTGYVDSNRLYTTAQITELPSKNIAITWSDTAYRTIILGLNYRDNKIQAKSIQINRNRGMGSNLNLVFDNKEGILSPDNDNSEYYQMLWPNKELIVNQGYGNELVQTYKGLIDSIEMTIFPAEIKISCRDDLKKALDQTITSIDGERVLSFQNQTVEDIFIILAQRAGLTVGVIEETGVVISDKLFSWETYGDAFSWLSELVGFEIVCDDEGVTHFRKEHIPDEPNIAYSFTEGVDIIQLGYKIDDNDLYSKVIVHGRKKTLDGEGNEQDEIIEVVKDFPAAEYYNLLPDKVLKVDANECDTVEKCEDIADKALYLMTSRARVVRFQSIGIPHLQIGDFIEVFESSTTISEIYRITDLATNQDANTYKMDITCHWYAHTGVVEEDE